MSRTGVIVRVAALVVAIIAFVVFETQIGMPSGSEVRGFFDDLGWIALPAFVGFYAVATLLPLPKSVCTIAGGAIFGFWAGTAVVIIGAVIGSIGAFIGARWLGRDSIKGLSADRVRRLDEQIGRRGFMTVLVARFVPVIPFTTVNYIFGLTSVRTSSYITATTIGIIPGVAVYVAVGAYGFSPGSWPFTIAVVGVIGLSIVGVLHARRVKAAEAVKSDAVGGEAPPAV